jgi:CRISPR-associated protein Cas2
LESDAVLVVIANDLPPAVRGRMKLWFIEPRANVFVSGIKDTTAEEVVEYLLAHCPPESGVLIIKRIPRAPGYAIIGNGDVKRSFIELSGLQLILEHEPSA